jgi:hypothetical protein
MPPLSPSAYQIITLFCAGASVCLAASIMLRMVYFMAKDPYPLKHLATAYRGVLLLAAGFMFARSLPVSSILLFDAQPQHLTLLTRVNFFSIWLGFPIVVLFSFVVEITKQPILGRLLIPPVELKYPTHGQVLNEMKIVAVCLFLASLVVLGKG